MKQKILGIALFTAILLLTSCPPDLEGDGIVWADPAFEAVVRLALDISYGDIMSSEVATIITLNLSGKKITTIDDLKYFTALVDLNLNDTSISDISALRKLDLRNNLIKDSDWTPVDHVIDVKGIPVAIVWKDKEIEAAARVALSRPTGNIFMTEVANLTTLDMSGKAITVLNDIKYFTSLIDLNLSNTKITDITTLSGLTKLIILDLSENPSIENWKPVAHIDNVTGRPDKIVWVDEVFETATRTALNRETGVILKIEVAVETILGLSGKNITKIGDIAHFTGLTDLNLSTNKINDISALTNLKTTATVDLRDNLISVGDLYGSQLRM